MAWVDAKFRWRSQSFTNGAPEWMNKTGWNKLNG